VETSDHLKNGATPKSQTSRKKIKIKTMNKIVNVTLTGGIIGLLSASPQNSLNDIIKKENDNGWIVIQVIPAASGNIFLFIFRLLILILTLFLYTPVDGYYVIMEKNKFGENIGAKTSSLDNKNNCSKCGNSFKEEDIFCQNCGNKLK
jgi:hypothetical protein